MKCLLALVFALLTSSASADDDEEIRKGMKRLQDDLKEAESWAAKEQSIARQRQNDCLSAFGHKSFCTCLGKELHWILSFNDYIRIATATPDQLSSMPTDERKIVDSAVRAREVCIRRALSSK